ncbi:MAG: hypothetical protein FJ088_02365, partial [Deltaproteobacteria bacterium]|nr:hypothetical protein [Deltaproteobacteria bacterium]
VVKNKDLSDDAVFIVNIDAKSNEFGKPVPLDLGNGNFPLIIDKFDNYFENDPRGKSNNILFEEVDEDIYGDGVYSKILDTDGDGMLDKPNTDSTLGEGVDGLLTFYEKETNTLIIRPIVPLKPETTYAVILTTRLRGVDKKTIQSPFPSVNFANQTEALEPLPGILPELNLELSDVAFTWTFTTQSTVRDIFSIRAGLYGEGTFSWLSEKFPLSGETSSVVLAPIRSMESDRPFIVPMEEVLPIVPVLEGDDPVVMEDLKNIAFLIAGKFRTPYFLADKDGVGTEKYPADDDEIFDVDSLTGKAATGEQTIPFFCAIPRESPAGKQPFPVAIFGHGYTLNLYESATYAGRLARFGIASCSLDAVGHGLVIEESWKELIELILGENELYRFLDAVENVRARDLNNDCMPDSGGDYWTADILHTRDVVRQTIIDYIQFIRTLRSFDGKREWSYDTDKDGMNNPAGDFDGNGVPDIGGPGERYHVWGQSLGGVLAPILAGAEPAIASAAPVSGGAGLVDTGLRSIQGGVPEAVFMPLMGPLIVANPSEKGGVEFKFLLTDVYSAASVPFHYTDKIEKGDLVTIRNLRNGLSKWAIVPEDYRFRVAVKSDALTAVEKHFALGMKDDCSNVPIEVTVPEIIGDPLEITIYKGFTDEAKEVINAFGVDALWQGALHKAGTRLVALQKGHGLSRNTPDFRKLLNIAASMVEPGDPVAYSAHFLTEPLPLVKQDEIEGVKGTANVLVIPTNGDMNVPVDTGIAIARAAGIIGLTKEKREICVDADEKWGSGGCCEDSAGVPFYTGIEKCMSENDYLINFHAYESIERLRRFAYYPFCDCREINFDVDNLSNGMDEFGAPAVNPPLRATIKNPDGGLLAMRIPFIFMDGAHTFLISKPDKKFDIEGYMNNLVGYWFHSSGFKTAPEDALLDHPCYEDGTCEFFP